MLNSHFNKKKRLLTVISITSQTTESVLVLALFYQAVNKLIFINNYSIKFMLAFILCSPEFFMAISVLYYLYCEKFKIFHNIVVITKFFQIILTLLLFTLGYSFKLYVYQTALFMLLGITIVYLIFNIIILILIKMKSKTTE